MTSTDQEYGGTRILEAMRSGVRYGQAIFEQVSARVPSRDCRVLDFGAGDGFFAEKFRDNGLVVHCVEPDPHLRRGLVSKAGAVYAGTEAIASNSIDFIYTINVLEHIPHLDQVCAELSRVLRSGGRLFVFVPAFNILWTSLDDEVGHVQRFRRASLRRVLCGAGLRMEEIRYFDFLGFPAALGVRALEKFKLFSYGGASVGFYDKYLFPMSERIDVVTSRLFGKNLIAVARKA